VVIDYLDLHVWPVFNVADLAVTSGAVLLIVSLVARPGPTGANSR
jgi:lipoprotein signal peptidase